MSGTGLQDPRARSDFHCLCKCPKEGKLTVNTATGAVCASVCPIHDGRRDLKLPLLYPRNHLWGI